MLDQADLAIIRFVENTPNRFLSSTTLRVIERAGKLQFSFTIVPHNVAQAPHQLELSKENEDQIVGHYVYQCEQVCQDVFQAANITNEQPEQQASLLKLIVDHHSDLTDLLELSERYQSSSLLENVSEDQLSGFLSPPQVRAVLREKQILIDKRFQRLTIPPQNFQFPVRLIPAQIPLQKP